jgi:hypothetical protein
VDKVMLTGLIYACVCVWALLTVFIYRTQNGKWLCGTVREAGKNFLHCVFAKF